MIARLEGCKFGAGANCFYFLRRKSVTVRISLLQRSYIPAVKATSDAILKSLIRFFIVRNGVSIRNQDRHHGKNVLTIWKSTRYQP